MAKQRGESQPPGQSPKARLDKCLVLVREVLQDGKKNRQEKLAAIDGILEIYPDLGGPVIVESVADFMESLRGNRG